MRNLNNFLNQVEDEDFKNQLLELSNYVHECVVPHVSAWDKEGIFPQKVLNYLHEQKIMSAFLPKNLGGNYRELIDIIHITYSLAYGSNGVSSTFIATLLGLTPIILYGNDDLKERVAEEFIKNKQLCAFAMTEEHVGIDVGNTQTMADEIDGVIVLSGEKNYITNGPVADHYTVFARHKVDGKDMGISAFYVHPSIKGFSRGSSYDLVGNRDSAVGTIRFNDCILSKENLLGEPGQGLKILNKALGRSKTLISSASVGMGYRALDLTVESLFSKVRGGKPLLFRQDVQGILATLKTRLDAAWGLALKAALDWESTVDATVSASQAKMFATDAVVSVINECMELVGAKSYTNEHELSRLMRDAKLVEIYEGSTTVQSSIIARGCFANHYKEFKSKGDSRKRASRIGVAS